MKVFIGADHRGYKLKETLKENLKRSGYEVVDVGASVFDKDDDYVDYAKKLCQEVKGGGVGVLLCGSGHGVDITANKHKGIRSILGFNLDVVVQGREDEDANVLSLAADWLDEDEAIEMVKTFLNTDFSGEERHKRRLAKMAEIV